MWFPAGCSAVSAVGSGCTVDTAGYDLDILELNLGMLQLQCLVEEEVTKQIGGVQKELQVPSSANTNVDEERSGWK